jgi:drug/metabolite transporter (DMT)-like permease
MQTALDASRKLGRYALFRQADFITDSCGKPVVTRTPHALASYASLLLAPMLWAGNFVIGRALNEVDPFLLNVSRWAVAGICLSPILLLQVREVAVALRTRFASLLLLSGLGVVGFNTLLYTGLERTSAGVAGAVFGLTPLLILIFSRIWGGQRVTVRMWIGTIVALAGVTLVLSGHQAGGVADGTGLALVSFAAVVFALYTVALTKLDIPLRIDASLAVTVWMGLVLMAPLAAMKSNDLWAIWTSPGMIPAILYLGIGASVVAFFAWQSGVAAVGPQRAGAFLQLIPVFGVLRAFAALYELISTSKVLGLTAVILGVLVAQGERAEGHINATFRRRHTGGLNKS